MRLIDETVQLVVPEKVMRQWAIAGVPTLVGLVGVQTDCLCPASAVKRKAGERWIETYQG
jgi:hypothetical protein